MAEVTLGDQLRTPAQRAWICAQLGWRVIPLVAKTKIPAIKNWPLAATTDVYQIDEWWNGEKSGYEVGVVTGPESGIWVLDIDVHWCSGFVSLKKLLNDHGVTRALNTFRVKTPSGGEQWYFRYPESGKKVRNIASKVTQVGVLGAGLDVRGWHGQVVAPLGLGRPVVNETLPIAAPDWLEELVTREPRKNTTISSVTSTDAALNILQRMADKLSTETTGRNDTLNVMSFKLGLFGGRGLLDEVTVRKALMNACVANGAIDEWRNGEGQFEATFSSGWIAGVLKGEQGE